jgi:glucosamine kinase
VGGSIMVRGMLAAPPDLQVELVPMAGGGQPVIPVSDGLVGAAVLVLRRAGGDVDDTLFQRIRAEVTRLSTAGA